MPSIKERVFYWQRSRLKPVSIFAARMHFESHIDFKAVFFAGF